jgi:hypothetical protein
MDKTLAFKNANRCSEHNIAHAIKINSAEIEIRQSEIIYCYILHYFFLFAYTNNDMNTLLHYE